jgi:superfamily I DNA/RNA helicase
VLFSTRNDEPWCRVRFNQVQGPKPIFNTFETVADEMAAIGNHLIHLIAAEDVSPTDICIIYNGKSALDQIEKLVAPKLANLYVAMTRARSLLAIYSQASEIGSNSASHAVNTAPEPCIKSLHSIDDVEDAVSRQDDFHDLLDIIGHQHRSWLRAIWLRKETLIPGRSR